MTSWKAIQPFFFSPEDEALLSKVFLQVAPSLRFLDDNRWEGAEPIWRDSIEACTSRFIYLWDHSQVPQLPTIVTNGILQGPASGVVIQFMRSKPGSGVLLSGQMSVGYSVPWVGALWKTLLSAVRAVSTSRLIADTLEQRPVGEYLVGPGAKGFSVGGGRLKHTAAEVFYRAV